jgi:hypothetical protein
MKRTAVFITATLLAVALKAQQETHQGQQVQSERQPTVQQVSPAVDPLEDDPGFKCLSPAQQEWVRKQVDNLNKAIEETRRDMTREQAEQVLAQDQAKDQRTKRPAGCNPTPAKKPGWFEKHFHFKPRVGKGQTGVSSSGPCPPIFIPGKR